ncbi:DsbA family protein [Sphingomonas dokdonensis]|uniref:Disulfide isomerase/thiol-disulfide oxidase n=1 Tax=Sphingomonas dokdonensis TaxID=344880 RepID=A0A245ZMV5_9SPHN|nr:DsbA family protein [Sphingomonas dokdonensis]OWK31063.1 disulfide isomerase/thiol-disulfide oxidase [Sphingomonas dokdonensis]
MNRLTLMLVVLLGAAFGAGGMWLAERAAPGKLGAADQAQVEQVVHDYVLANPELIPQAMQKLQERESGRAVAANRSRVETPYAGAVMGNPNGDVTLVEFFDYNCGYCRASLPTIDRLVKSDPKLRVVFRELPILAEESRDAARASLAAAKQGRFAAFHEALYAGGQVSAQSIAAAARQTGVDLSKIPDDADTEIAGNLQLAAKLGISGTPAWVVGDKLLSGALPFDRMQEAIAEVRAARN